MTSASRSVIAGLYEGLALMARPKGQRRGRYRMTPARRAALKKRNRFHKKRRRREIAGTVGRARFLAGTRWGASHH